MALDPDKVSGALGFAVSVAAGLLGSEEQPAKKRSAVPTNTNLCIGVFL